MSRIIGVFLMAISATIMLACEVDPPAAPDNDDGVSSVGEDSSTTSQSSELTAQATNCSIVQWCNQPDSPRGAVCLEQSGCSLATAKTECVTETQHICGSPPDNPWVFITTNNVVITHTAACGFAISCNGHCCGLNDTRCGANGACCDGNICKL